MAEPMDTEQNRKLFVGGIPWQVDETILEEYFSKYGEVEESVIVLDRITRQPREFGFVTFTDPLVAKRALEENHSVFGKRIDVRPSEPRRERNRINQGDQHVQRQGLYIPNKVFVGGLPHDLTEDEFKDYFAKFGAIDDGVIIYDKKNNTPKGFGFITFESDEVVIDVLHEQQNKRHELKNKLVEVMRAVPQDKKNDSPMMKNWYDWGRLGLDFWGWLQFDDLAFGLDRLFCYNCGGAYGYGHSQGCLYRPNPYNGVWYILRVMHTSWIGGGEVDPTAWNGYSNVDLLTYVNPEAAYAITALA